MFERFLLNVLLAVKTHLQYGLLWLLFFFHVPTRDVGRIIVMYWLKCAYVCVNMLLYSYITIYYKYICLYVSI